jgi:hypothetical protein
VLRVWDPQGQLLIKVQRSTSQLYLITLNIVSPTCLTARGTELSWRWHGRYRHLGFQGLTKLAQGAMVCGLPSIVLVDQSCEGCLAGKQRRNTFPVVAMFRATRALELTHADLCSPIMPPTSVASTYSYSLSMT